MRKSMISIKAGGLVDAVAKSVRALVDAGIPIFRQDDVLVRPLAVKVPAADGRVTQAVRLKQISPATLLLWLSGAADYEKYDKRAKQWQRCDPPRALAEGLLETPETWQFPTIAGVITCPTMRHDGSILSENGYDRETMLYLEVDPGLRMGEVKKRPTLEDARLALERLKKLLGEFPFKSNVDRAVALAQIITFAVRGAMPTSPAFLCRSPVAGSGKSYLNDLANAITSGRQYCPVLSAGQTMEETEKRIGAALLEGANVIAIDNCTHDLSGDALCQLTERPRLRIRILGFSEQPEIDNRAAVTFNGNNIGPRADMKRRTLLSNLDPKLERPEFRRFRCNPVEMVLANRGAYLADIFTIIRAYLVSGDAVACRAFASYEQWSRMVREPLIWLGEVDPVASTDQARREDDDLNTIGELLAMWERHLGIDQPYTAVEIAAEANKRWVGDMQGQLRHGEFHDILMQVAGRRGEISTRSLGWYLRKNADRIISGFRIEIVDEGGNNRAPKFILRKEAEQSGEATLAAE